MGAIPRTEYVSQLPLAVVPNAVSGGERPGLFADYSGRFRPEFRLNQLTDGALAAAAREFQMQSHLKAAANEASIAEHVDKRLGQSAMEEGWIMPAWIVGERVARALGLGTGPEAVAQLLAFTPVLPPGFDRSVNVDGDQVTITFTPVLDGLLDPEHPGLVGALARAPPVASRAPSVRSATGPAACRSMSTVHLSAWRWAWSKRRPTVRRCQ